MRESEFHALLIRLDPTMEKALNAGLSRVLLASQVAKDLWMKQAPETEDTASLRYQLWRLEQDGRFNFTEWDLR